MGSEGLAIPHARVSMSSPGEMSKTSQSLSLTRTLRAALCPGASTTLSNTMGPPPDDSDLSRISNSTLTSSLSSGVPVSKSRNAMMSPRGLICFNVSKAGALLVVTHLR